MLDQVNKYKNQLLERAGAAKDATSLRAALRELKGEQIEKAIERGVKYDHIQKVQKAQEGLEGLIESIKNRMSYPKTPQNEFELLKKELSDATKLLNRSREFVPKK